MIFATFRNLSRILRDTIIKVHTTQHSLNTTDSNEARIFSTYFRKILKYKYFIIIYPVAAELLHTNRDDEACSHFFFVILLTLLKSCRVPRRWADTGVNALQISLRLSPRRTAVHMPADSMSTMRPTSCAAHTECKMNGWLIVGRVRMTQNCQRTLLLPCVKVGQREWTWPLGWCGCNNMQSALNLAHAIGDPDHHECYFSVSKHIPVQYDKTARCRSVPNTCPVTIHDRDTTSLLHLKQKRFITKGTDCNFKQHIRSLAHRICSGSGGGGYSVTTAKV